MWADSPSFESLLTNGDPLRNRPSKDRTNFDARYTRPYFLMGLVMTTGLSRLWHWRGTFVAPRMLRLLSARWQMLALVASEKHRDPTRKRT